MPGFVGSMLPSRRRHLMAVSGLSADKLRDYLEQKEDCCSSLLVLDTRSFLAFNDNHITMAVNMYCPSILRRRAGGKLPLNTIISTAEIREKLQRHVYDSVVLYDESSMSLNSVADDAMIRLVARCLYQDLGIHNILFLEGGFQLFHSRYPHLCQGLSESTEEGAPESGLPPPTQPAYDQGDPVEILGYLYLGSARQAANSGALGRLGITALLNVSRGATAIPGLLYKCIPVEDSGSAEISRWFHEAIDFIDSVKASGGKVLVHCQAGVSRSATICLAYLMHSRRLRLDDAYEFVKSRRSVISPNFNFMGQLLGFEAQVFSATDSCLKAAQRFVFDLPTPDDGYSTVPNSATPLLSPILSPS